MKTVAVLINDKEKQYEGLRSSLGMLLYNTWVQMFVVKSSSMRWRASAFQTTKPTLKNTVSNTHPLKRSEKCCEKPTSLFRFKEASKMKILHILRTRPEVTVEKLMQSVTNGDRAKVTALYEFQNDEDWSQLVDEIFSNDKVISWW
jgi:hypothetical protein